MRLAHPSALVAITFAGACVSQTPASPEYGGEYAGISSGPGDDWYGQESSWSGPPGGAIDPGYGYADPTLVGSPSELGADPNAAGVYGGAMYGGQAYGDPTASGGDPAVWAGATAEVTDAEIDMTLEAYGEWVEDPDYGRVWRPYTTVVGAEFTPYETCGDWVFTDYGWTFQSCDAWSWGWLPFHFGRWVFLDNSWCWSRDYTWGPGWVEWRHGGGYVGWRPMPPTRQIRDHRDRYSGPRIRDHRRGKHEEWRFQREGDFGRFRPGKGSIGVNEGLRATTAVGQPPVRGDFRGRVGTVMAGRLHDHQRFETRTRGTIGQSTRGYQPSRGYNNNVGATRGYNNNVGATRGYNPTHNPTVVAPNPNRPTWNRGGYRYNPPANSGYRNTAPSNNGYRYNPPARSGSSGGYRYNPPSRPSSSWGGSRGSAPSPSSRPSSSWGGSRPSAPSRSYSPPSRSSSPSRGSYSAPSRSSSSSSRGSYSAPSRSSSSSSRGSSSSSSSSSSRGSSSSSGSRSSGGSRGGRR